MVRRVVVAFLAGLLLATGVLPVPLAPSLVGASGSGDPYGDAVLADSPLSYWRLDETSGTVAADATGGNAGVIQNGVVLGEAGAVPGHASMSFDGIDDFIELPGAAVSLKPAQLSVEAWFRASGPDAQGMIFRWRNYGYSVGVIDGQAFGWVITTSGAFHKVLSPNSVLDVSRVKKSEDFPGK